MGSTSGEAHIEVGILPILLERKKLILERILLLKGEEKVESIRDLVERVGEEDIRSNLLEQINQLEAEAERWKEQSREVENSPPDRF